MNALLYGFNLPWRGAVIGAAFYAGLSFFMVHLAKEVVSIFSFFFISLSVMFGFLGIFMLVRRIIFPRILELTEDAILFPHGFPRTRVARISFADIIGMRSGHLTANPSFCMATAKGDFEIGAARFKNIENYQAVKNFICSRTSIQLPQNQPQPLTWKTVWFPDPILYWRESEDYIRYRTHLAVSKSLRNRLAKAIWFFARCFGFIFLPWLILNFFQVPTMPIAGFLALSISVSTFFTLLHWLYTSHPARVTEIAVRKNGMMLLSGKQTWNLNFSDCLGWAIIERKFEDNIFHILLLQRLKYVFVAALPDVETRDQLIQIFNDKKIPQLSNLKPSWES
jgi:Na+(H+)/acetate symporter ActP